MDRVLILDTETTGIDADAVAIEVAVCVFDVKRAVSVRSLSTLVHAESNPAEKVNRIPADLLSDAPPAHRVWRALVPYASLCQAVVAHNADFDRRFVPETATGPLPWICSCNDLAWPCASRPGEGLVSLALAHNLGVAHAHRAAADVELLARLFSRVAEMGHDLDALLSRGLRPKVLVQALVSYDDREKARVAGFRWNEDGTSRWLRKMPLEDAEALPFKVRVLNEQGEAEPMAAAS
jgi:DNA polymerase-3 subunit epsilon